MIWFYRRSVKGRLQTSEFLVNDFAGDGILRDTTCLM